MSLTYTTVAVQDLPYPPGLGKGEHERLKARMQSLLRSKWIDPAANAEMFWEPQYQMIMQEELSAVFDEAGAIEDIARQAFEQARSSSAFGVTFNNLQEAHDQYTANLPRLKEDRSDPMDLRWLWRPPEILRSGDGVVTIIDGRHRLSYLRARVQPLDPNFPVLVRYYE